MVAQTDRRLLWHPRLDDKFLVGGSSQITLYEWAEPTSEIKHVTSKHWQEPSVVKCMAWSPDPAFDDLIAVGFSSGKVDLLRMHDAKSARNPVSSNGPSLSSGPSVTLPVRNSRPCNTLAFCSADPNYLAVGLDKVRGDASLVIWDVLTATATLSIRSPTQLTFNVPPPGAPPRPQPQIPRGDLAPRTDPRVLQQLAQADTVSSVAFLPKSTTMLLAGISHRWLRLFDFRNASPLVFTAASKVHGIATDPFDPHRIGCYGDGVATIWDTRRLSHPLLTFTEKDASADGERVKTNAALSAMEFSPIRRGVLATLERDASHVRFWDLQQVDVLDITPDRSRSRDSTQSTRPPRLSWTTSNMLPWSSSNGGHVSAPSTPDNQRLPYNLVLSDTRRTKDFSRSLASFAFMPTAETCPLTSNVMVVNKEGDLELYAVHDTPVHTPWSPRGDLAMGIRCSYSIFPGSQEVRPPPEPWDIPVQSVIPVVSVSAQPVEQRPSREEQPRGRNTATATLGRGDDDGFPALTGPSSAPGSMRSTPPANLAATRPGRTYSPAALRNMFFEHGGASSKLSGASASPTRLDSTHTMKHKTSLHKSKDISPTWTHPTELTMQHAMEDDISMVMRQRVTRGYGLANILHNSVVVEETFTDDTALSQLWAWLHHSQKLLAISSSSIDGYNFSYQGINGIWEGFRSSRAQVSSQPTPRLPPRGLLLDVPPAPIPNLIRESQKARSRSRQGRRTRPGHDQLSDDFASAVTTLMMEAIPERPSWKPAVTTNKLPQRQLILQLCGWSLAEEDMASAVKRWEKEHNHSRAACWLVFTRQNRAAVDVLMRSKDESHHMMSGLLAALSTGNGAKNPDLREHCERLIIKLHDPYLRAMLTHLTNDDWTEVLQEEALPTKERVAIALQFLSDRELSSYLRRIMDRCIQDGDIEGLIFTGLTTHGMELLQTYLDTSGDIQSVALLASLNPARAHDTRVERWLNAYRDLLDQWRLFHYRCQLDIDRGRILNEAIQEGELAPYKWAPPQISLRCNYCNKPMTPPWPNGVQATSCVHCGRPLPRCSICLMTLSIVQDPSRNAELSHTHSRDTIDDALVFCQTCRHGGHASHILEWFIGEDGARAHETCPVASCQCHCIDGD